MRKASLAILVIALVMTTGGNLFAGGHTWRIGEAFSNADGTIQFIEVREAFGLNNEVAINGRVLSSNTTPGGVTIAGNAAAPTGNKRFLFGTPAFQALPGVPQVNFTISANFFNPVSDTLRLTGLDTWVISNVPTDGYLSRNKGASPTFPITTEANTPTNYAGVSVTIDLRPPAPNPAAVPTLDVIPLDTLGASLQISWDTTTCAGSDEHQIIFGQGSQLPLTPGGAFGFLGGVCGLGTGSPFTWNGVPDASDGTSLLWFLMTVLDGTTEGSLGHDSAGLERVGPGAGGSSGQCGITASSVTNACGN